MQATKITFFIEIFSLVYFFPFLIVLSCYKFSPNRIPLWVTDLEVRFILMWCWHRSKLSRNCVPFPPSQAVDYYLKALRSLGARDIHPAVWDSVNWELSTTYFTMATLQQDYAPLSRKAQEQVLLAGSSALVIPLFNRY